MAFSLPPLPYAYNALEPHIDEQTMRIHHDKHHDTYVKNLNAALEPHPDLQKKSVEELLHGVDSLPEAIRTPVRNNGGSPRRQLTGPLVRGIRYEDLVRRPSEATRG